MDGIHHRRSMLIKTTRNMKKVIYALIVLLVVIGGLVFASREINMKLLKQRRLQQQTWFLDLQMAERRGKTLGKGCRKICG